MAGQARWIRASGVAGATAEASDSTARPTGRGARARHGRGLLQDRPVAHGDARHVRARRTGHMGEVGRGDDALPVAGDPHRQALAAVGIELAHDVVEQEQRRAPASLGQRLALGDEQRQQRQPLLALRPVGAQGAPVALEHEVVAVRAVAGEAPVQIAVHPFGELGGERLGRRCVRPRAGSERSPSRPGRAPRPAPRGSARAAARRRGRDRRAARRRGARARRPRRAATPGSLGRRGRAAGGRCAAPGPPPRCTESLRYVRSPTKSLAEMRAGFRQAAGLSPR